MIIFHAQAHYFNLQPPLLYYQAKKKKLEVVFTHVRKTETPLLSYFLYS